MMTEAVTIATVTENNEQPVEVAEFLISENLLSQQELFDHVLTSSARCR